MYETYQSQICIVFYFVTCEVVRAVYFTAETVEMCLSGKFGALIN